jgi:hypothetical protein
MGKMFNKIRKIIRDTESGDWIVIAGAVGIVITIIVVVASLVIEK